MCDFKTQRFEAVEINVPSGTTLRKFNFPDLPNLTGRNGFPVVIDSIEFFSVTATPKSPITGADVISNADLAKSFLTVYQGDLQVLYNIPCNSLVRVGTIATGFDGSVLGIPLLRDLINVSWTKCFISTPAGAPTGDVVYSIGVHYTVVESQTY
jgi:hypothetical protein